MAEEFIDAHLSAVEKKQANSLFHEVTAEIIRNDEKYDVKLRLIDFRKEDGEEKKGSVHILIGGFGLMGKKLNEEEKFCYQEAKEAGALYVMAAIEQIPPGYDKQHSEKEHKTPSAGVDARMILEALKSGQAAKTLAGHKIDLSEISTAITGYSEGAYLAVEAAREIDRLQREKLPSDKLPINILRMCSAAGVVDLGEPYSGVKFTLGFSREVLWVALIESMRRYKEEIGDPGEIREIDDWQGIKSFAWKIYHLLKTSEGRKQFAEQWRQARGIDKEGQTINDEAIMQNLLRISGRSLGIGLKDVGKIERLRRLWNQMKKMEPRSSACDQLGKNWQVYLLWPRKDTIFPWKKVLRTIGKISTKERRTELLKEDEKDFRLKRIAPVLFPKAGKVKLEIVGDEGPAAGKEKDLLKSHYALHYKSEEVLSQAPLDWPWWERLSTAP